MISSELVNVLFGGFAKFVSKMTHREVKFEEISRHEVMSQLTHKINSFFEQATEALGDPSMQVLGTLEPGKIYCIQVDMKTVNWDTLTQIADVLLEKNILFVVVDKDMNFVSMPEGYEVITEED
jgi:hypothetical protein